MDTMPQVAGFFQVSFRKRAINFRALLWKENYKDKASWAISLVLCSNGRKDTGWWRCIGCLKLHVSFHKRAINYRALLWKENYKDEAYNWWLFCGKKTIKIRHLGPFHVYCVAMGGKNMTSKHALSCRSLSANEPSILGLFCGKKTIKIRHLEPFHIICVAMGDRNMPSKHALSCRSLSAKDKASQKSH